MSRQRRCLFAIAAVTAIAAALCWAGAEAESPSSRLPGRSSAQLTFLPAVFGQSAALRSTAHFTIVHDAGAAWGTHAAAELEKAYERFFDDLTRMGFVLHQPGEPLVWLGFSHRSDFDQYALAADRMDLSHLDAYYSARTNRTAMWCQQAPGNPPRHLVAGNGPSVAGLPSGAGDLDQRLVHETVHQLTFNSGLLQRGVMYPLWVSEGIATYYEADSSDGSMRRQRLAKVAAMNRTIPLGTFVSTVRITGQDPGDVYAQAWGTFAFLLQTRPDALKRYLTRLSQLPPGPRDASTLEAEFVEAFGPIKPLDKDWQQFLTALPSGQCSR